MNVKDIFLVVTAALIVSNIVNKLVINPLINKLKIALFGSRESEIGINGSAKSEFK